MSTPAQITAKWPDGTPVVAGDDARAFVFTEVLRVSQDPQAVLRLALRDNLAGRTILALLGLTHEALKRPAHRPEDQQRQSLILGLVDEVSREEGLNGDELFAEVARLLADPKLRQKRRLGGKSVLAVRGNGHAPGTVTVKSARNAYRAARKALAKRLFQPIGDEIDVPTSSCSEPPSGPAQ